MEHIQVYIPIWIDLKRLKIMLISKGQKRLHSNMDRFKEAIVFGMNILKVVYIPIWIDLKSNPALTAKMSKAHLHSNMDRFKGI